MSKTLKYLLIFIIIFLLFGFFAYREAEAPTEESKIIINNEIVEFDNFKSEKLNFSTKVPKKAQVSHERGRLKIIYTQQENMATEVTDGFSLFIDASKTEDLSLKEITNKEFEKVTENLESISEPQKTEEGYSFQVRNGLGGVQEYKVFQLNNYFIISSHFIANPENNDYQKIINKILKNIKFNE